MLMHAMWFNIIIGISGMLFGLSSYMLLMIIVHVFAFAAISNHISEDLWNKPKG